MARRCFCEQLFRMLEQDVRLRTAPAMAQMIWLKLMRLAAAAAEPGVLRFGAEVGFQFGFLTSVSLAVTHTETEVETALGILGARGLVEILPDGAGLRLPEAQTAAERGNTNRINGSRGGRPRKGESREAYLARRQGSLMMPITGGKDENRKTEPETPSTSTESESLNSSVRSSPSAARALPAAVSLGEELAEILGMDPARGGYDFRWVQDWLDAGIPTDVIRGTVERKAEVARNTGRSIWSFKYLDRAVREAGAAVPPVPQRSSAAQAAHDDEPTPFQRAMDAWREAGMPDGMMPRLSDFQSPRAA